MGVDLHVYTGSAMYTGKYCISHSKTDTLRKLCEKNEDCKLQYCAKVMQTIIDEYREYRDILAIFNEILP